MNTNGITSEAGGEIGKSTEDVFAAGKPSIIRMNIPAEKQGWIIGPGGSTIRDLESRSNCKIRLIRNSGELIIEGRDCNEAQVLVNRLLVGKRLRPTFTDGEAISNAKLYVDILNFVDSHFFLDPMDWSIHPVLKRAKELVDACNSSNTHLCIFIDSIRTDIALDKWYDRMTKNILAGTRNVPQNISGIMAEVFYRCGCEVRLSTQINNDDTLASWAHHDNALILSGDRDFYLYKLSDGADANLQLFSEYDVRDGILLIKRQFRTSSVSSGKNQRMSEEQRVISNPPPRFHLYGIDPDVWSSTLGVHRSFRGGSPSPLVKTLKFNPYIRIRPLRALLYWALLKHEDQPQPIREEIPIWNEATKTVIFPVEYVPVEKLEVQDKMWNFATNPKLAFEHFFPRECDTRAPPGISDGDWYRHCHGCKVILIEICCMFPPLSSAETSATSMQKLSFLDCLIESESW
jgi:hypothetical protein